MSLDFVKSLELLCYSVYKYVHTVILNSLRYRNIYKGKTRVPPAVPNIWLLGRYM